MPIIFYFATLKEKDHLRNLNIDIMNIYIHIYICMYVCVCVCVCVCV